MFTFRQFLEDRQVDPVSLAQRASRRFGKKTSFGKWEKVHKGGHLPLTSYNGRKVGYAAQRDEKVRDHLGDSKHEQSHTHKVMKISDLRATQAYVDTHDVDKLRSKVHDTSPSHIRVVTHKGEHYIDDGHHAVMAAKMRGETHVKVRPMDLDQHPKRL